ncbi:hypothetical protein UPYG_G00226220 [Umbra pygmaea]|uniref:Uncharacterized protein n=1 Tax=Umbra pygmaea TaxID=75934 RepID=A0ABD0WCL4_UMBPY
MGGPTTPVWVLLLSAAVIGWIAAESNTTPMSEMFVTDRWSSTRNSPQMACYSTTLNGVSSSISRTVDTLTNQVPCVIGNNQSLSDQKISVLQQDLRSIMDLTINVFLQLGKNKSQSEILDVFGILNSLNTDKIQNVQFIQLWLSIQLAPLLPYVTGSFLTLLSTKNFSCSSYQALILGLSDCSSNSLCNQSASLDIGQQQEIFNNFIYPFLSRKDSTDPGCTLSTSGSKDWLKKNFGSFSIFAGLYELHDLNPEFSSVAVLDSLSPNQKAELILDPSSGALENETLVREVFASLLESEVQLEEFFVTFVHVTMQENISIIENKAVRDTILNLTLTALAPEFYVFEPVDFQLWFQVNLQVVLASFSSASLVVIPLNITCESYKAIFTGLDQSLASIPLDLSHGVMSSLNALTEMFQRCPRPPTFIVCTASLVNVMQICAGVSSTQLEQQLSSGITDESICNFNISEYACSLTSHLSADNLAKLLTCQLASNNTYSTETWLLLFQNNAGVLDQAVLKYSSMNTIISSPSMGQVLDAIGEIVINNFSDAQLNNVSFIKAWFQQKLQPFLASPSSNLLSCLSSKNFSCQTYQIVVKALSSQSASMSTEQQQLIFTQFIYPFLTRNDSSDPGCVSNTSGSIDWLQRNLGVFSVFAELSELEVLYSNFSSLDALSLLTASQVAEWTLSPGTLNDKDKITLVFKRLEEGDAFQNIDTFLTQLTTSQKTLEIIPVVRDYMMNQTFTIISPDFPQFKTLDWIAWFEVKLTPILPSFTEGMLTIAISNVNCTNYQVIVQGMSSAFSKMTPERQSEIAKVLLNYLTRSTQIINGPACRQNIQNDTDWLQVNLGPYSEYTTYLDLIYFNISGGAVLDSLSPNQKAELLLDPKNLANETLVEEVFVLVLRSSDVNEIDSFFQLFVEGAAKKNLTAIEPGLRDTLLNLTLTALAPTFNTLDTQGFTLWFQVYLQLFLPGINPETFSTIPRNISCDSFSAIIKGCDNVALQLSLMQSQEVFMFIIDYLTGQSIKGLSCVTNVSNSDWLESYFGQFRIYASYVDFVTLNSDFNGVEVADLLTPKQLAQLASTPSQLKGAHDVNQVMASISPAMYGMFFDIVSPAIQKNENNYTEEVKSAFLQVILDSVNLSSAAINDTEFLVWLRVRLNPLLVNLSSSQVAPLFTILLDRSCNGSQETISLLNTLRSTLTEKTQMEIYSNILLLLKEPTPLRCYTNGSFYSFLERTLLGFGFPNLSMLLTLVPEMRQITVLNSITPSELSQYLSQPEVVNNSSDICALFNDYADTPNFLETKDVPDPVKTLILPCVWPLALNSNSQLEVDAWFDLRLNNYLRFLTLSLISPPEVQNASCLAFQKLVSVLGNDFSYNSSDFGPSDVYSTIKSYLITGSKPKCYNASEPKLNSTAWFVNYIGVFITYLSLDDLSTFVTTSQFSVFLENQANINLFGNPAISANVTSYFISQLYILNPTYSPMQLPGSFLCQVPSTAYEALNQNQSVYILNMLQQFCNGTQNQQVSAALAANLQTITTNVITTLGSSSTGLTTSQLSSISTSVLISSLPTLGSVSGWNIGQASAVIQTLVNGGFQIDNSSSLLSLGTLIQGVPSSIIRNIPASDLLATSKNPMFVTNMLAAPEIIQEVYVSQIISINQNPDALLADVPDALATQIPSVLLTSFQDTASVPTINNKSWSQAQAGLFFEFVISSGSIPSDQLSQSVLQGFSCTAVQFMTTEMISGLVHSYRPRPDRRKLVLHETQLTCMYNLLKTKLSQNFTDYPSDLLLYYNFRNYEQSNCRSYFSALGSADFSVPSSVLNKDTLLLNSAKSCLNIPGVSLSKDNVDVLGNMVCTLSGSYIQKSDPSILEKLKNCKDFTTDQVRAIETLLLSGTTKYGNTTTWNEQTLFNLGILPLYLTSNIWGLFTSGVKRTFLQYFMPQLRNNGTSKADLKALFQQVNSPGRTKRGAECTTGNITQTTIADPSFPFGYDLTQFDLCLDTTVLKDNLAAITSKVDDNTFQTVILKKLNQAFPLGINDQVVEILGSVSRVATVEDISSWRITKIDTLAALMNSQDGPWDATQSNAIITIYLNSSNNSLGSFELNAIGSYVCSLSVSVLKTITPASLKNANALNITSCSTEQKITIYNISKAAFNTLRNIPNKSYYMLISAYLGGAPVEDIRSLATLNVSMDIATFRSLDINVVTNLSVSDVKGLLGTNLDDLKTFENDTVVMEWVAQQLQSDLDTLGIGLTGGRASPMGSLNPSSTVSSNADTATTRRVPTTATVMPVLNTTTQASDGGRLPGKHLGVFYLCLALMTIILQMT